MADLLEAFNSYRAYIESTVREFIMTALLSMRPPQFAQF